MSRNPELDSLKSKEQEAFQRKQQAFQRYADAREQARVAHDAMQSAWERRSSARENMNREYDAMQSASAHYKEVWDEYGRIRDHNNSLIDSLRREADYEHEAMKDCFDRASAAYEYGDKSEAPVYSQEGHEHKDRRDELNDEVRALIQEVRDARQDAEWRAPKTDSSAFRRAKEAFERAKEDHESAQTEFKRLKSERDRLKSEFDSAQEEHTRLKEEFNRKLQEVKANNRRERDETLDKAGIRWSERENAKIVKKADGTIQVYHGGIGKGDGLGHGHTVVDRDGNKVYDRDAFEEHGSQNYTGERTRWDGPHQGVIIGKNRDYDVTFSQGMGKKSGQTLIADGHLNEREFRKGHNHYGPNDKNRFPDEPDSIEDSSKHKDDSYYNGPGH